MKSVPPRGSGWVRSFSLCYLRGALWLCGVKCPNLLNHRDTENAEDAQRTIRTHPLRRGGTDFIPLSGHLPKLKNAVGNPSDETLTTAAPLRSTLIIARPL